MKNGQEQARAIETQQRTTDAQQRSFEASLEALEQIVRQLESGDLPLEQSLELFEQGIRLSRECQDRLSQAERRIEVLLRDNQGRTVVAPFEPRQAAAESTNENTDEHRFKPDER